MAVWNGRVVGLRSVTVALLLAAALGCVASESAARLPSKPVVVRWSRFDGTGNPDAALKPETKEGSLLVEFRIVGLGQPIPSQLDRGPCPEGRWSQALYAATLRRRVGTVYGCGLSISKGVAPGRDPAWIHQIAREHFVLPGGSITATCDEHFQFSGGQHHSHATFHCKIGGGRTVTGGGVAVDGRADYLLTVKRPR